MVEFTSLSDGKCVVLNKDDVSCVYEVFDPKLYGSKKLTAIVVDGATVLVKDQAAAVVAALTSE